MDSRAKEVLRIGDAAFGAKRNIDSLWQEIALNFYTERADFTFKRNEGEEFSDHLFSSYPQLCRRELGNMLSEFLRPGKFFSIHVNDEELDEGDQERAFLEQMTDRQWRFMSDPEANLVGATGEADHDFAAFGNAVIHVGLNVAGNGLLYCAYHLRDNAWCKNVAGRTDGNHRNWNPTAWELKQKFGNKVSAEVNKACEKDPQKTFSSRHVVLPSRLYDYSSKNGRKFPYVSLFVERESETVLEEVGLTHFPYVIPRWQTISGSAYGVSMATSILLPDGRTLQVVMRTLREAGETYVNPPMVAISDAIRGDIALYAGGVTTADIEYDERLGEVLRPVTQNQGGFPIGFEIATALKDDLRSGFFLDKIKLPETSYQMTATQVRRIIQEHIRAAAPISKPIQQNYNQPLCDVTFQILKENGAFSHILANMPETLSEQDLEFKFRSPLDELAEQNEADTFVDIRDRILMPTAQIDPSVIETADLATATRDAMRSAGWKAKWFKPKEAVDQRRAQIAQEQEAQQMAQELAMAGQVAEQGGKGIDALATAGASVQPQPGVR